MVTKLPSTQLRKRMNNGEMNDLYDKLRDASKEVPTLHEYVKELCADLRKPRLGKKVK